MFHVEHFWDRGATSHSSNCSTWNTALVSSGVERGCSTWNIAFPPQPHFLPIHCPHESRRCSPDSWESKIGRYDPGSGPLESSRAFRFLNKGLSSSPPPRSLRARLKRITEEIRTPLSAIHEKMLHDFRVVPRT